MLADLRLNQLAEVSLEPFMRPLLIRGSQDWRAMFAIGLIPALGLALATLRLPESPSWLIHHSGRRAASSACSFA